MKKFLNIFFVTLGVIFLIIILLGIYLYATDPFGIRPLLEAGSSAGMVEGDGVDKNPVLNEAQESALEAVGIDPADVPTEITSEQEQCFIRILGAERVAEIKAGDTPTPLEVLKAKDCI